MPLVVPRDGRITSQNVLTAPLDPSAVMEIVSPGSATLGNTYQVTLLTLAAFFAAFPALNTLVVQSGATLISPLAVPINSSRILFDKTVSSASYAVCPLAATMLYEQPVFFKDMKGDAAANPITISFTSGELCDGLSQLQITSAYGWVEITPVPGGGAWYQSG